jgi:hypothetical protein
VSISDCLTAEQVKAFQEVQEILDRHFDQWTLAIESDLVKSESLTFWTGRWGGKNSSTSRAIGLLASHLQEEQEGRSSNGETEKESRRIGF